MRLNLSQIYYILSSTNLHSYLSEFVAIIAHACKFGRTGGGRK